MLRLGFAALWLGAAGWLAYRLYLDPAGPPVPNAELWLVLVLAFTGWNLARWYAMRAQPKAIDGAQPRRPKLRADGNEYHPEFDFTKPDDQAR